MPALAIARRSVCAAIAAAATLLIFGWTTLRVHYAFHDNWTAVFCTGTVFPVPPDLFSGTYRFDGLAGYDGQFYRYVAHDPFLHKGYWHHVDAPRLRYRRLLVPLAAWAFGWGERRWIDRSYIAVEMVFVALGVYWCARLLTRRGRSPAWGLLFMLAPATLASFDRMLVDGPLTALFAGFLLYCEEEKWGRVWVIAMLASLTRETGLFLPAALMIDQLLRGHWRRAAEFASSCLPALIWYGSLSGILPPDRAFTVLTFPASALLRRLFWVRPVALLDPSEQVLLVVTDFLAVFGLIASLVLAAIWLLKMRRSPETFCVYFFVALTLVLATPILIEPFAFGRPISPMLLWLTLEAISRRTWIALTPPLLVSVGTSVGFISPLWSVVKGLLG